MYKGISLYPRQLEVYQDIRDTDKVIMAAGAIRTAKTTLQATYATVMVALTRKALGRNYEPKFLSLAKTMRQSHRTIRDAMQLVHNRRPEDYDPRNKFAICPSVSENRDFFTCLGAKFICVGHDKPHSVLQVLGMNVDGIIVDEATLMVEESFQHLIGRLNRTHAQIFMTTNPGGKHHYLYRNFVTQVHLHDNWKYYQFKLEDNPDVMADKVYLDAIKSLYTGHMYRRYILGEWCDATGLVYANFGEGDITEDTGEATDYIVGYDHGMSVGHRTCAVLVGYNRWTQQVWVEKEFVTEPTDTERFGNINYIIRDFWRWLGAYQPRCIYVDPSATAVEGLLANNERGIPICHAYNSVTEGISCVMRLLGSGHLKIHADCTELIEEMYGYRWDETRSAKLGRDVPIKEQDDCVDALRYAVASYFDGDMDPVTLGLQTRERRAQDKAFGVRPSVTTYRTHDVHEFIKPNVREALGFGV